MFCNVVFTCEGFYEMSRQFSIPTVLRMVPNVLLCQFFERLKCGHFDIDWTKLGEREVRPIHKEILQLSRLEQDRIEGTLRSIFDLACDSGIDAIFEAAAKTGDFDLPLSDIVMPEMDGIELAQRCAEISPHTKVMFITGFAAVSLRASREQPTTRVLSKPFHLRDLVLEVERVFEEAGEARV